VCVCVCVCVCVFGHGTVFVRKRPCMGVHNVLHAAPHAHVPCMHRCA
jgi:hypothetical protein